MAVAKPTVRSTGRLTRVGFAAQVVVVLLLAVAVCSLLVHVAEWRKLRVRVDLTATGRNTLDERTVALLDSLEEPAVVDIFFRPSSFEHMARVTSDAQRRMTELLFVARSLRPEKLQVTQHDLLDVAAAQKRMGELGIGEVQSVVVSYGGRRAVLRLFAEIAEIDVGSPDPRAPRPATLHAFRGEEALAEALKQVSSGDSPRVYFTTGHGEPGIDDTESRGLASLVDELDRQGFDVGTWEGAVDGPVPDDADVVALVSPVQPLTTVEVEFLDSWVARGGRLFVATEVDWSEDAGSASAVLRRYGMSLRRGLVCLPVLDYFGAAVEGTADCADFHVSERELNAQHPITGPLVQHARRVRFVFARSFERGDPPPDGFLLDLASSPSEAWRDMPNAQNALDFTFDAVLEQTGRHRLAMAAEFPVTGGALLEPAVPDEDGDLGEGRVVGVTSPFFLANSTFATNRDFALNAFNWLVERDFRVGVSPRDPSRNLLDLERGPASSVVFHASVWGLPGVFGLLGLVTFLRRRR